MHKNERKLLLIQLLEYCDVFVIFDIRRRLVGVGENLVHSKTINSTLRCFLFL